MECQVELDFQHSVGEACDLGAVDGQAGVAVPPAVQRQYSSSGASTSGGSNSRAMVTQALKMTSSVLSLSQDALSPAAASSP